MNIKYSKNRHPQPIHSWFQVLLKDFILLFLVIIIAISYNGPIEKYYFV